MKNGISKVVAIKSMSIDGYVADRNDGVGEVFDWYFNWGDTIQPCLNAGLLDEIHVDVAAVLLGSGVRLFDRLAITPAVLGNPKMIAGVGVSHLRYPVCNA